MNICDIVLNDVVSDFQTIISGLLDSLGDIADFFLTNTLGLIILGVALFGVVWSVIMSIINKVR